MQRERHHPALYRTYGPTLPIPYLHLPSQHHPYTTAGDDGAVRSWQFDPANKRFAPIAALVAHTRPVTSLVLMATESPPVLFSAGEDGTVRYVLVVWLALVRRGRPRGLGYWLLLEEEAGFFLGGGDWAAVVCSFLHHPPQQYLDPSINRLTNQ